MSMRESGKPSGRRKSGTTTSPRKRSAGTGRRYLITAVGEIPLDIDEMVSSAHASAISAKRAAWGVRAPAASRPPKGM